MMNGLQSLNEWEAYFNYPAGGLLGVSEGLYPS